MCLARVVRERRPNFWAGFWLGGPIVERVGRTTDRSRRIIHKPKTCQEIEQRFVIPDGHFRFSDKGLVAQNIADDIQKPKETRPRGSIAS
jgi:hypothetical protein